MKVLVVLAVAVLTSAVGVGSAEAAEPLLPPPIEASAPVDVLGPVGVPFTPPPCVGIFSDVPCSHQFATWIEQLYRDRITTGCGGGNYCPSSFVTRGQMAAFLERMARGTERWPVNVATVQVVLNDDGSPNEVASGQALRNAIGAIPTSGAMASSYDNPYLVAIGPGRFDIGSGDLSLPVGVALTGAGRRHTTIKSYGGSGTIVANGYNLISDVLIVRGNSGGNTYGIYSLGELWLENVYVGVHGGDPFNIAVYTIADYLEAHNSEFWAQGSASEVAVYLGSGAKSAHFRDCEIYGSDSSIRSYMASPYGVWLAYSILNVAPTNHGSGDYHCVYNVSFSTYAPMSCP